MTRAKFKYLVVNKPAIFETCLAGEIVVGRQKSACRFPTTGQEEKGDATGYVFVLKNLVWEL